MTEHTPGPADAPWLVTALRDIAETAPVAPAPPLHEPALRRADEPGRRRNYAVLAAAAVVLLLLGAAVAVAVRSGGDDDQQQVPASVEAGAATGWYVPQGLPDGWSVEDVSVVRDPQGCPCTSRIWAGADGWWAGYSAFPMEVDGPVDDQGRSPVAGGVVGGAPVDPGETVDLDGATGRMVQMNERAFQIEWVEGEQVRAVSSSGIPKQELIGWAQRLVGQPTPTEGPEPGWDLIYQLDEPDTTDGRALVNVELETPDGNLVRYLLMSSGEAGTFIAGSIPEDRTVDGQSLPMTALEGAPGRPERIVVPLVGRWPGSDVYVDLVREDRAPTQAEVDELAASLRPASPEQWRSFLADAGNTDPVLTEPATFEAMAEGG